MFGYIICGVLLGPSGLNSIKVRTKLNCLVSVELELMKIAVSYKSYQRRCLLKLTEESLKCKKVILFINE